MTDDIVTRLRIESASSVDVIRRLDMKCFCCPCCEESCLYCETVGELTEAADEIERLRIVNTELVKMFKQVGVVAEMWQKTEDELIEIHHGKCAEQFAEQHKEIERLQNRITQLLDEKDELRSQALSWKTAAENFDNFNENRHNDNCGYGSLLTQQTVCYCGRLNYEKTKEALDGL